MQAEEINHTLHNLYTLRGAKVRNGDLWAKYIHDTINRFGDEVEVSFGSHHWPTWGNEEVVDIFGRSSAILIAISTTRCCGLLIRAKRCWRSPRRSDYPTA